MKKKYQKDEDITNAENNPEPEITDPNKLTRNGEMSNANESHYEKVGQGT